MEIKETKHIENIDIAGNFESKVASIDEGSMSFLFEMMSKSLYSNPIGSIVREITSNCFDSHREANVDDAVVIKKDEDEEGIFISFIDYGVGLSPSRIDKIYMKYFSSTKRETNDQIGGFGLGSKTPLSYQDYFYIITNFDKKKYTYILSKGVSVPTLDLMDEQDTEDRNGTEIKVYIKNTNDVYKFKSELEAQLCYFDNVYFQNWNIENEYKIYELKYSKYRNINQYRDEVHIILGTVAYPIDWTEIELNQIEIPIGVKFEIGELQVTPNRENLRYTDEIKALVKERVELAYKEILELFESQNPSYDNYFDWYARRKHKPFILFGDSDKLYLNNVKDVDKKYKFPLFDEFPEFKDDYFLRDLYSYIGNFSSGKEAKVKKHRYRSEYQITEFIEANKNMCYISSDSVTLTEAKCYTFKNGYVFRRIKYNNKKSFVKYTKKKKVSDEEQNYETDLKTHRYFDLGRAKRLYNVIKIIRQQVEEYFQSYRELDEEELTEFKEWKKENNIALQRRLNGKVLVHSISEGNKYEWKISGIEWYKGLIIYGNRDETKKLEQASLFLSMFKTLRRYKERRDNKKEKFKYSYNKEKVSPNAAKVIMIAQNNEQYFENRTNMIDVNGLYSDHPLFRKLASCYRIEDFFKSYLQHQRIDADNFILEIAKINQGIGRLMNLLIRYRKENYRDSRNGGIGNQETLKKEVLEVANSFNLFDPVIESTLQEVIKWFEGIEILKYTEINDESLPYILKYLREKGKKLNYDYYCKYVEPINSSTQKGQIIIMFPEEQKETGTKFEIITKSA